MDTELIRAIAACETSSGQTKILTDSESEQLRLAVAERFGFPTNRIWWWECLPETAVALAYAGGEEGLEHLARILPDEDSLRLFVTDDCPPPWPCVCGTRAALIEMLREQRFFEYFIVAPSLEWIVFDTHHNVLLADARSNSSL